MQPEALKDLVLTTLEDHKADEIVTLDISDLTTIADFMVICSSQSAQHTQALTQYVVEAAKAQHERPLGTEGENVGEWVLIDLGDVVVHIMLPETRAFYSLEKLWSVTESYKAGE